MNAATFRRALHSARYRDGYDSGRRDARNGYAYSAHVAAFGDEYAKGYREGYRDATREKMQ